MSDFTILIFVISLPPRWEYRSNVQRTVPNDSNHLAALREYRRLKHVRKGPISKIGLKMIMKFEDNGNLGVLRGKGRKPIGTETVEEVATAVVERAFSSIYSSASV
ncbi:hypothetical protein TNCV_492591 [Trichonephila clavipes]|nr:hypothetical protein TNCV_492591 [Trichonephila clavipes]